MGSGYGKRRLAAEDAGTFVETGPDVTGFAPVIAPHSATPTSSKPSTPAAPASATTKSASVSSNASPARQVQGVSASSLMSQASAYTGGSLKLSTPTAAAPAAVTARSVLTPPQTLRQGTPAKAPVRRPTI